MKTIALLFLYLQFVAQDCMTDISRHSMYDYMEVYNWTSKKYEKFNRRDHVEINVDVIPSKKMIWFTDTINGYDLIFRFSDCDFIDTGLIYRCQDTKNNQDCKIEFSANELAYYMTVRYDKVLYRTRRLKLITQK